MLHFFSQNPKTLFLYRFTCLCNIFLCMFFLYHHSTPSLQTQRSGLNILRRKGRWGKRTFVFRGNSREKLERREALCRQLSESESSLEMDDERCINYTQTQKMTGLMTLCTYMIHFENNTGHTVLNMNTVGLTWFILNPGYSNNDNEKHALPDCFCCAVCFSHLVIFLCLSRYFNEMSAQGLRARTVSSPIPYTPSPSSSRPISPGTCPHS